MTTLESLLSLRPPAPGAAAPQTQVRRANAPSRVDIAAASEAAPSPGASSELAKAATEFEAYLLKLLWQEMRKTTDGGGLFGRSSLRGYDTFIDEALTQRAAEAGSFGLATQLLNEWERKA